MRRLAVYRIVLTLSFTAAVVSVADRPHDPATPPRTTAPLTDVPFDGLFQPNVDQITPREACNLAGMVLAYLQYNSAKSPFCNATELATGCQDIIKLSSGAAEFLSRDERAALHRKKPGVIKSVFDCLKLVNDAKLNSHVNKKTLLLKKKEALVKAMCPAIGAFAEGEVRDVNYEDPCWEVLRKSKSRGDSCWRTGEGVCKILSGEVELENLIPPSIYDASVAKQIPIDLPEYLEGSIDGALDLVKKEAAGNFNGFATRKVLRKGGNSAVIALAAFAAAAKQINLAAATGNNDWAHCLGTDTGGACFHKLFLGGIPESKALATAKIVDNKLQIDCCYCELDLMGGPHGNTKLSSEPNDFLTLIEKNDFKKTLCYQLTGTKQEKYLSSFAGYPLYFQYNHCRKVTVTGNSCLLKANPSVKEIVRVLEEGVLALENKHSQATKMTVDVDKKSSPPVPKKGKQLYAVGDRPSDPKVPAENRFAPFFTLPPDMAPAPFPWDNLGQAKFVRAPPLFNPAPKPAGARLAVSEVAPMDLKELDRSLHASLTLPNRDLRQAARPSGRKVQMPARNEMPPALAMVSLTPALPALPPLPSNPVLSLTPRVREAELPAINPAPPDPTELSMNPEPPVAPLATDTLANRDLRKLIRPDHRAAKPELKRANLPPLSGLEIKFPTPPVFASTPAHTAIHLNDDLPPVLPAPEKIKTKTHAPPRTPKPASPAVASNLPAAPPMAPPPSCVCLREIWTVLGTNQSFYVCAVRNNGVPFLYSLLTQADPTCEHSCPTLYSYPQSARCFGSTPAQPVVYATQQSPSATASACLAQGRAWPNKRTNSQCAIQRPSGPYFIRRRSRFSR